MAAIGAIVGPPAPLFWRVCGSVMPKNGVSSAPEYVVGIAMCGSAGRSAYDAPGVPASCSVKKHDRLAEVGARPAAERHDAVDSVAARLLHRRLHQRRRHVRRRPRRRSTRARAERLRTDARTVVGCGRPAVVTSSTRRAPIGAQQLRQPGDGAGAEDELLRVTGVGPRPGSAIRRRSNRSVVERCPDRPLLSSAMNHSVPKARRTPRRASRGRTTRSLIWLRVGSIDSRLRSTKAVTSTACVMIASGDRSQVLVDVRRIAPPSGPCVLLGLAVRACRRSMWSRFMVAS